MIMTKILYILSATTFTAWVGTWLHEVGLQQVLEVVYYGWLFLGEVIALLLFVLALPDSKTE